MIHWSFLLITLFLGICGGIFIASLLHAADDEQFHTIIYRDKHGILIRDDGRHIQQYDPESGEWKTIN